MNKKFNFTQARIKDLPSPDKGRFDYVDTDVNKLVCRVSHTGNKSFIVTKRYKGELQNVTIGKFPDVTVTEARKKARAYIVDIGLGINPTAAKRKEKDEQTKLEAMLERYISDKDLKPYTVKNYRYKLKLGFSDWLNKPISSISKDMIIKRHKKLTQSGKTTANTTMRVLRLTLNHACNLEMIDENPASILSKAGLWHKNNRKDRVIPSNQLQVWHEAVEALPNQKAKVYLLMALYMGFRSTELLTLEWSHIDIKGQSITLYDTKNGTNHRLPIPNVLMPHLNALKGLTGGCKWTFEGDKAGKSMTTPIKPIKAVIDSTGVEFSPHDCRRTFATIAEAVNLPMSMIKRLMNHVTTNDVTGGYIVTEEETLRMAINKVADYIQARVTQKDNIIQLHASK
jgi:integrase